MPHRAKPYTIRPIREGEFTAGVVAQPERGKFGIHRYWEHEDNPMGSRGSHTTLFTQRHPDRGAHIAVMSVVHHEDGRREVLVSPDTASGPVSLRLSGESVGLRPGQVMELPAGDGAQYRHDILIFEHPTYPLGHRSYCLFREVGEGRQERSVTTDAPVLSIESLPIGHPKISPNVAAHLR